MTIICPVCDRQRGKDGKYQEVKAPPDRATWVMCPACLEIGRKSYVESQCSRQKHLEE